MTKLHLVFLYLFLLDFSVSTTSDCEKTEEPKSFSDCKGKKTEKNTEICCYAKYKQEGESDTECLDINSEDSKSEEKLVEVENKIEAGEYWDSYTDTYEDVELICNSDSGFNVKYLNGIFSILVYCLLF